MKTLLAIIGITLIAVYLTVSPVFETLAEEIIALCQFLEALL